MMIKMMIMIKMMYRRRHTILILKNNIIPFEYD